MAETQTSTVEREEIVKNEESAPKNVKKPKNKKKWKKYIFIGAALAVIVALIVLLPKLFGGAKEEDQVLTDFVSRGALTSTVHGSGVALPKNSATITLLSGGLVQEVYVSEGDYVTEGTPLYSIESSDAQQQVNNAIKSVNNCQKELNALYEAANDLNVRAEYAGKLLEVSKVQLGDDISKGQVLATLVDDTKMLLSLYFSYAYEGAIAAGQSATVSIPSAMAQLDATVKEVNMVRRISNEGSLLFEVVLEMNNPGTLTQGMAASATLNTASGAAYPYESGTLEYYRTTSVVAKVSGEVAWTGLMNYAAVSAGESLVSLTGESNELEIASAENALKAAQKELESAQKNLDSLNAFAPIDGTVLTIGVSSGEEAEIGTVAITIADLQTMVVNATVDEMNVSYIKPGMWVDINQWDTMTGGIVESVSLNGQYENGVSNFPIVITVDNPDGTLMSGSYVEYSLIASQSDDCLMVPIQCIKYVETPEGKSATVLFVRADEAPENMIELMYAVDDIPEGFYPVEVETGISDNYNAEILSGVEEGTEVFSSIMRTEMW